LAVFPALVADGTDGAANPTQKLWSLPSIIQGDRLS
jgi:hypothetical protein